MGLGFMSGFITGLGKGLDEFNKTEERNRQREIQILQADRAAKQRHDANELAWSQKFKSSADSIMKKQEELRSANSKLSKAEREKAYNNTAEMMNSLISSSGSIAGEKGYTTFANIAEPYMASGSTDKIIDVNGWGVSLQTKTALDNGSAKIGPEGNILTPKLTTNSQGATTEELDDNGNIIFEPSGEKANRMSDIFATTAKEFKPRKMYMRNNEGKVVSQHEITSAAELSLIQAQAKRDGHQLSGGVGKDVKSEQFIGYDTMGGQVYFSNKSDYNQAVQNGEVSQEPGVKDYMSTTELLEDPNLDLKNYYVQLFGRGMGYSYKDASKMHYVLSQTTHLNHDQIKSLMKRTMDYGIFGRGQELSRIDDAGDFNDEERMYMKQALEYVDGKMVIATISARTERGHIYNEKRLMKVGTAESTRKHLAETNHMQGSNKVSISWENMSEDKPTIDTHKLITQDMSYADKLAYNKAKRKYGMDISLAKTEKEKEKYEKKWNQIQNKYKLKYWKK